MFETNVPLLVLTSLQDPCCYPYGIENSEKTIEANPNV